METIAGFPFFPVEITKDGKVFEPDQVTALMQAAVAAPARDGFARARARLEQRHGRCAGALYGDARQSRRDAGRPASDRHGALLAFEALRRLRPDPRRRRCFASRIRGRRGAEGAARRACRRLRQWRPGRDRGAGRAGRPAGRGGCPQGLRRRRARRFCRPISARRMAPATFRPWMQRSFSMRSISACGCSTRRPAKAAARR